MKLIRMITVAAMFALAAGAASVTLTAQAYACER
jgi:hypothetical protein